MSKYKPKYTIHVKSIKSNHNRKFNLQHELFSFTDLDAIKDCRIFISSMKKQYHTPEYIEVKLNRLKPSKNQILHEVHKFDINTNKYELYKEYELPTKQKCCF